jgi:ATP dependent DNA ligase-like protein
VAPLCVGAEASSRSVSLSHRISLTALTGRPFLSVQDQGFAVVQLPSVDLGVRLSQPLLTRPKTARRGEALTADAMKNYRWLRPELVAQVEFAEWTTADHLRNSRFVALRDDKPASAVRKNS